MEVYVANPQQRVWEQFPQQSAQQEDVYINRNVYPMPGTQQPGPDMEGGSRPVPSPAPPRQQLPQHAGGSKGPGKVSKDAKGPKGPLSDSSVKKKGAGGRHASEFWTPSRQETDGCPAGSLRSNARGAGSGAGNYGAMLGLAEHD